MNSTPNSRRRPWEDDDVEQTTPTATARPAEEVRSAEVKPEAQFFAPPLKPSYHHNVPPLHLETAVPRTSAPSTSETLLPGIDMFATGSPSMKRPRTDISSRTESGGASSSGTSKRTWTIDCCSPICTGRQCERMRLLLQQLMSEMATHEILVHGSSNPIGEGTSVVSRLMEVVLERMRQSNISLKTLLDATPMMPNTTGKSVETHTREPTFSGLPVSESPIMPMEVNLPSGTTAEGLQHQLALKIEQLHAAQNELQRSRQQLEAGKAEYVALERKNDVADAEIVRLSTEKERLELQLQFADKHVKELELSRNEARKSSSEMASQYLRIVQMAGRLHKPEQTRGNEANPGKPEEPLESTQASSGGAPHGEVVQSLEAEIERLQSRNIRLENGMAAAKQATQNVDWILRNALEDSHV